MSMSPVVETAFRTGMEEKQNMVLKDGWAYELTLDLSSCEKPKDANWQFPDKIELTQGLEK